MMMMITLIIIIIKLHILKIFSFGREHLRSRAFVANVGILGFAFPANLGGTLLEMHSYDLR